MGHQLTQLLLQLPELGGLGAALLTAGQVRVGAVEFSPAELAVDEGGQPVTEMTQASPARFSRRVTRPWRPGPGAATAPTATWLAPTWLAPTWLAPI